ncbi:hypothetical protein OV079_20010 [Nannocystis pusilla]|uniref:DNA-directed RNA polymerase n=1 Tax=Nannocystis pusilla TaxID=889268 RepID=A0A9X3IXT1_9BACT|nr:hypothetical protein [Nannocystis pusilla]MCY1007796.1 hypothetical protein [Nannocystis pusilla]
MPAPPDLRALLAAFFAPAPAAGPVALLRAAFELRARSSGALTTAAMLESRRPIEGGPWCPRLFGPLEPLRCRCGRLVGPEHRGETCERCHVLCSDEPLRERLVAHVDAPFGLVHPALAPRVAALIGLSPDQLRAVLHADAVILADGRLVAQDDPAIDWDDDMSYETGVRAVRRRLAILADPELAAAGLVPADLVLTSVPVSPPGERPLYHEPHEHEDRWFRALWSDRVGRDNESISALTSRALRGARLVELDAPKIILDRECADAQRAFEAMLDLLARPPGDPARAPRPLSGWLPAPLRGEDEDHVPGTLYRFRLAGAPAVSDAHDRYVHHRAPHRPEVPRACVLADGDRALIQLGYLVLLVHWPTGHVLWTKPVTEAVLLGARGDWALFGAKYGRQLDLEDPTILRGLYALDLSSGTWLEGPYPDHLPAIFVEKDEPEDAWLTDWRGQRGAPGAEDCSGDRPNEWARSPDHRYIWMTSSPDDGAVLDTERGVAVLMLSHMREPPGDGVRAVALTGPERDEEDVELDDQVGAGIAIARPRGEWRTLLPDGRLRRDGRVALEFTGAAIECAAFDLAGDRLLLVNRDALHVVDVAHGLLLAQLDLRPLAPALALPESLPRELADLLLAHHGTLAAALAQPDAHLRELGAGDAQLADLRAEPPPHVVPSRLLGTCLDGHAS